LTEEVSPLTTQTFPVVSPIFTNGLLEDSTPRVTGQSLLNRKTKLRAEFQHFFLVGTNLRDHPITRQRFHRMTNLELRASRSQKFEAYPGLPYPRVSHENTQDLTPS
jgi:hypothetical protein